jgi:hypothetical protein
MLLPQVTYLYLNYSYCCMEVELKSYQPLKFKDSNYIFYLQDCLTGMRETIRKLRRVIGIHLLLQTK